MKPLLIAALLSIFAVHAALRVVPNTEEIPERGPVTRYMVQSSLGIFSLIPPTGWANGMDGVRESLNFQLESANALFWIKFSTNAPPRSSEQLTELVSERWPKAQIIEKSNAFTRDSQGTAVDCSYEAAGRLTTFRSRIAFVPYAGGHIELTLSAPDGWPPVLHRAWTTVLNSLQSEKASARRIFGGG